MRRNRQRKDLVLGTMIGTTLGALTAMMFTTKKGHQMQRELMSKYHEFEDAVKGFANKNGRKAKRAMNQIAEKMGKKVNKKKRKAKRAMNQIAKRVEKKVKRAKRKHRRAKRR